MKKVLSLLLAAVMLLSVCPFAFAANTIKNGSRVEFGSYPQTMMTDEDLIAALDAKATLWTSYNYSYRVAGLDTVQNGDFMKYCDVTYNGVKYRGVKMTAYRPDRTDSMCIRPLNAKFDIGVTYWYRYEPLVWRVLDIDKGLLISDQVIDSQPFCTGEVIFKPTQPLKYQFFASTATNGYANRYTINDETIGGWLIHTFKKTAFTSAEQDKLQMRLTTSDAADAKFRFSDTYVTVSLLTLSEVTKYMPFRSDWSTANGRGVKSSDYAKIQGVEEYYFCSMETEYFDVDSSRHYYGMYNAPWLTSTPGVNSNAVYCIDPTGYSDLYDVRYTRTGVRPVICLSSSDLSGLKTHYCNTIGGTNYCVDIAGRAPTCTNPGITAGTGAYCTICNTVWSPEMEEHIEYDMGESHSFCEYDTACEAGDAVYFGSYPQSRENDDSIISQLNTMQLEWKSYDYYTFYDSVNKAYVKSEYMKYTDVDFDGDGKPDHRGVLFTKYRPCSAGYPASTEADQLKRSEQDDNGYQKNTIYWFKYEPLVWRVLDRENGILMCENVIDAQAFNDIYYEVDKNGDGEIDDFEYFMDKKGEVYANDYTQSSLRKFLNSSFYNIAFSSAEKKNVMDTTVSIEGEYHKGCGYRGENIYSSVTDKVFLLSFKEYLYSGLIDWSEEMDDLNPTDYALCQGCYVMDDGSCAALHLRNAFYGDSYSNVIWDGGDDSDWVDNNCYGIAPVIKVNNIEELLHVHDFVEDEAVDPNCVKDGKTAGSHCSTCGKVFVKQEKIDRLGHTPEKIAAKAPTCETAGCNTYYVCTRCEKAFVDSACTVATTVKTQTLAALGHDWDEGTVTKAPTCTLKGSATLTCQRAGCDKTKTETIPVDENAHIWGAWTTVTAPTCTAAGSEKRVCTNNKNHTETRTIAPIGHDWDEGTVTTPATCVKEGEKTYSCKRAGCTETKPETIAKDAAKHGEKEIKNAAAATCGKDGYTGDTYCKNCGAKTAAGTVIKATGAHAWDAGKVTKEASIGVPGVKTYTCTVCGNTKTEEIPALKDEGYTPGDVDADGKITAADARLALRRSVGLEDYKEGSPAFLACDVDFDGKATAADARLILRASVGLEDPKAWKPAV